MLGLIKNAFLSSLGSRRALGALERIKTKDAIRRDWERARGRYGWNPTPANVQKFLEISYGFDWWHSSEPDARLSSSELNQIFDSIAPDLLARGMVEDSSESE